MTVDNDYPGQHPRDTSLLCDMGVTAFILPQVIREGRMPEHYVDRLAGRQTEGWMDRETGRWMDG
jgi:hypothetical protein